MSPLSFDMSTTAAVQEIGITADIELKPNTSKSSLDETDIKMQLTHTTNDQSVAVPSVESIVMDLTTTTSGLSITQKDISTNTPVVALTEDLLEVATTSSFVMDNNVQVTEPAITAPITTAISTDTTSTSATTLAATSVMSTVVEHSATTATMAIADEHTNEIPQEIKTITPPATEIDFSTLFGSINNISPDSPGGNDVSEGNNLPPADTMPSKVNENSNVQPHDEVDNVLPLSSNEDTTRIVSSTDSKTDSDKNAVVPLSSQTEPPKPQETKNKLEGDGKNVSNTISASFVVLLSMAVLYVMI